MESRPAIAILTPNVLMGLGLKGILERMLPMAEVEIFADFATLADGAPERFFHYFVATQIFIGQRTFFQPLRHKTILLTNGQPQPQYADMHQINVFSSEEQLVRDIMRMHRGAHGHAHTPPPSTEQPPTLTAREAEVLTLIAQGCLNKQIADRLGIGLTTVISHRRNLTEKLGIRSASGLTIYAVTAGYVDPDAL